MWPQREEEMYARLSCIAVSLAISGAAFATDIRSGAYPWPKGKDGVTIPITPPVSGPNSPISVQPAATAGYSPTSECTYFNVLKVTASDFQVQHKTCKDGTPIQTDDTITLFWILVKP
jgi:hypothetical protein